MKELILSNLMHQFMKLTFIHSQGDCYVTCLYFSYTQWFYCSKCILVTLSTQQTFFVELSENKQTKLEIGQLWQEDNEGNTIQRLVST